MERPRPVTIGMNADTINTVNFVFAIGTFLSIAVSLVLLIGLFTKDRGPIYAWTAKNALFLVFLISLAGMAGSLTYQFIGFVPCPLCWYQRILMYPVAIMSFIALVRRRATEIWDYVLVLSVIGGLIAIWHNIEKFMGKDVLACDAIGASCLQNYVKVFGFIDIPVMSLSFFIVIILIILNRKRLS